MCARCYTPFDTLFFNIYVCNLYFYSNGTTAPSYVSLMYSLISSDFNTSTNALIESLFSLPSLTAIIFTYVCVASESAFSLAIESFPTEKPA